MAPEWEMGMEFGMGMGAAANNAPVFAAGAASPAYLYGLPSSDTLRIDDLLDFSNHELFPSSTDSHHLPPQESSYAAAAAAAGGQPFGAESGSSSDHRPQFASFPDDLYIPSEEAAELEWLSKFVEDSFSDNPYPPSSATNLLAAGAAHIRSDPSSSVPGRGARSKRYRAPAATSAAAAATWSSLAPPPPSQTSSSSTTSSSSSSDFPPSKTERKKGAAASAAVGVEGRVRRCTHCASEKTPQWRTGPLGPKTLCNACGVRYKSGRLVPEYRPAASPTFLLTQHSNSHRKVMELRRQKELHVLRHDGNPSSAAAAAAASFGASAAARSGMLFHDYEVC